MNTTRPTLWILTALLLLGYPLALMTPAGMGTPLRFVITTPTLYAASLLTLAATLLAKNENCEVRTLRTGQTLLLITLVWAVVITALDPAASAHSMFIRMGLFSIPIFFALTTRLRPTDLTVAFAIVWLLNTLYAVGDIITHREVVGLTGNRNWMASTTLALLPWAWLCIIKIHRPSPTPTEPPSHATTGLAPHATTGLDPVERRSEPSRFPPQTQLLLLLLLPLTALALVIAGFGRSRAAWLTLAAYLLFHIVLCRLNTAWRTLLMTTLAAIALTTILRTPQIQHEIIGEDDIRPALWHSTVALIADHPVKGVGSGRFRAEFPTYRSEAQMRSDKAAAVNDHPHNEVLHLAAEMGIPITLAWCALLIPLVAPPPNSSPLRAAHFTAFMIVGHAMLDKTLVQQPTALTGLVCLGLCWRPLIDKWNMAHANNDDSIPPANPRANTPRLTRIRHVALIAITLVVAGVTIREVRTTTALRRGMIAEHAGQFGVAYKAYALAAEVNPDDIRGHAYAGTIAIRHLRRPHIAVQHLAKAMDQEPNFGHINRWLGMALGVMKHHDAAAPFFRREAELFPFSEPSCYNYYQNAAFRNHDDDLKHARDMLRKARVETMRKKLGTSGIQRATGELRQAVRGKDKNTILTLMYTLTEGIRRAGLTVECRERLSEDDLKKIDAGAHFTATDIQTLLASPEFPPPFPRTLRMQALYDILENAKHPRDPVSDNIAPE